MKINHFAVNNFESLLGVLPGIDLRGEDLLARVFLAKIGPFPAIPLLVVAVFLPLLDNGLGRVMIK